MAIKGKRRSKSRSASSRHRPAAVRPTAGRTVAPPWYRTQRGQLSLILLVLALIGIVMWIVSSRSSAAAAQRERQEELTSYTSELSDLIVKVQQPVREMHGAAFNTANPEAIEALRKSAPGWGDDLEALAAVSQNLQPPEGLQHSATTIQQALLAYRTAARTYELVPDESDIKRQQALIDRATEQRDQAGVVLVTGLAILDDAREEADMQPSGIQAPSAMTPIIPTPEPIETTGGGGSAGGDGSGNDGGSGSDKKKKRDG